MDVDTVIAIASVLAVFVSSISVVITVISIKKQVEFNKDSVKPICSIYLSDYNNFISVRIENDGLGPAKIKKIKCICNDGRSSETLYDLLPENLKHGIFHNIFTYKSKKLTLTAHEKLYLISITPESEQVWQKLIDILRTVTIYITYLDIYGKKYNYHRKLDSIGANINKPGIKMSRIRRHAILINQ